MDGAKNFPLLSEKYGLNAILSPLLKPLFCPESLLLYVMISNRISNHNCTVKASVLNFINIATH